MRCPGRRGPYYYCSANLWKRRHHESSGKGGLGFSLLSTRTVWHRKNFGFSPKRLLADLTGCGAGGELSMPAKHTGNREKILLINGKSETSLLVSLEQEGYDVTVCESPQRAWGFVYPIRPHFIILHLEQPSSKDIYGLQECRALADGVPLIIAIH